MPTPITHPVTHRGAATQRRTITRITAMATSPTGRKFIDLAKRGKLAINRQFRGGVETVEVLR